MIDAIAAKYATLLMRLHLRTQQGRIPWTLDGARDPIARIGNRYVALSTFGPIGARSFKLWLRDLEGAPIESVTDEDLADREPLESVHDSFETLMSDLRTTAFRQAVGADAAIDDVIRDLE